jgi:hypothetical protein
VGAHDVDRIVDWKVGKVKQINFNVVESMLRATEESTGVLRLPPQNSCSHRVSHTCA